MTIQFNATPAELRIIGRIVYRAVSMEIYKSHERTMCRRDLDAVHSNGCPLRLADLLAADRLAFAHDLSGIKVCIDRNTGKLDMFRPRSARGWVWAVTKTNTAEAAPQAAPEVEGWPAPKTAGWAVPTKAIPDGWGNEFKPTPGGWGSSF
jgi:uncharacterized protein DUF6874